MSEFTPYQLKIIKRYYENIDAVKLQRLSELVSDLYLLTGKKLDRAWENTANAMQKMGIPQARIDHLVAQKRPELIAELVKELQRGG